MKTVNIAIVNTLEEFLITQFENSITKTEAGMKALNDPKPLENFRLFFNTDITELRIKSEIESYCIQQEWKISINPTTQHLEFSSDLQQGTILATYNENTMFLQVVVRLV